MTTPLRKHIQKEEQQDSNCSFNEDWIGLCPNKKPCATHKDLRCVSCGEPATKSCPETFSLVCGAPLCDDCEHVVFPDGTNGGFSRLPKELRAEHVRKGEQIYKPWYMREEENEG